MRIGELAELVGVSTRAVRHYHNLGVLPEPARHANGYRQYTLRDAVLLARVKRLTDLGLTLSEVRDVLSSGHSAELRDILTELDADLARQEAELRQRRARLAELLRQDTPHPDDPVSAGMAEVLRRLPRRHTGAVGVERRWLAYLDTVADEEVRESTAGWLLELGDAMGASDSALHEAYAELEELADATPDDPRVEALAARFAAALPPGTATMLAAASDGADAGVPEPGQLLAELAPAQAAVIQRMLTLAVRP